MVPSLHVMTELKIHTYTAAEPGLFVNSYLLETAEDVVLVDAGLLLSDARALAARVTALRKPLPPNSPHDRSRCCDPNARRPECWEGS
jgi:hypothetical protein